MGRFLVWLDIGETGPVRCCWSADRQRPGRRPSVDGDVSSDISSVDGKARDAARRHNRTPTEVSAPGLSASRCLTVSLRTAHGILGHSHKILRRERGAAALVSAAGGRHGAARL
jgi:hypothetical protein